MKSDEVYDYLYNAEIWTLLSYGTNARCLVIIRLNRHLLKLRQRLLQTYFFPDLPPAERMLILIGISLNNYRNLITYVECSHKSRYSCDNISYDNKNITAKSYFTSFYYSEFRNLLGLRIFLKSINIIFVNLHVIFSHSCRATKMAYGQFSTII